MKYVFTLIAFLLITSIQTLSAAGVKTPPSGLIMRGKDKHSYCDLARGEMDGGYCQIAWSDLEPSDGNFDFSLIDNAIVAAQNYNAVHGQSNEHGFKVLIRIRAGVSSPQWVKNNVGSIDWYFKDSSDKYSLPLFWENAYQQHYTDMMQALANRYDSNPTLGAVAASMCMTKHAEIMWNRTGRSGVRATNMAAMRAVATPYTNDKDWNCLAAQIRIHAATWTTTPTIFGSHLYQEYSLVSGEKVAKYNKTITMADYCGSILGQRCMMGNNSLLHNENNTDNNINKVISYMASKNYPTYYQTHVFANKDNKSFNFTNLKTAINKAASWGALMIEMPMGWDCTVGTEVTTSDKTTCTDAIYKSSLLQKRRGKLRSNLYPAVGVNSAGTIYIRNKIASTWNVIPGALTNISTNSNGDIWGVNSAGSIYHLRNIAHSWTKVSHLRGDGNYVNYFSRVSVSEDGVVWALDTDGYIFFKNGSNDTWHYVSGRLTEIAAGKGGKVWGINSAGYLYYKLSFYGAWAYESASNQDISICADGYIWRTNTSHNINYKSSTYSGWSVFSGGLNKISAGSRSRVWGLINQNIYKRSGWSWTQVGGKLTDIAAR